MVASEEHEPMLHEAGDAAVADYRPLSKLAIASLLFGLLAPAAVIFPTLILFPLVGAITGAVALVHIGREGSALVGRKAALAGLVLSILFGTAAPGHWITHRWLLRRDARQFAVAWFDLLKEQQPQKAYQLTQHPNVRRPLNDALWDYYKENPNEVRNNLEEWVSEGRPGEGPRLVRTLLALGEKAKVRYFSTQWQGTLDGVEAVKQIYAVSYDEGSGEKTFFVSLLLKRFLQPSIDAATWQISSIDGGVRPLAYGGTPDGAN